MPRLKVSTIVGNGPLVEETNAKGDVVSRVYGGDGVQLLAGSKLPDWATDGRVGDHCLEPDDDQDPPTSEEHPVPAERPAENAVLGVWRAYAEKNLGLDVPAKATKKQIIALVDADEQPENTEPGDTGDGDGDGADTGDGDAAGTPGAE